MHTRIHRSSESQPGNGYTPAPKKTYVSSLDEQVESDRFASHDSDSTTEEMSECDSCTNMINASLEEPPTEQEKEENIQAKLNTEQTELTEQQDTEVNQSDISPQIKSEDQGNWMLNPIESIPAYNPEDSSNEVIYPATSSLKFSWNRGGDSQTEDQTIHPSFLQMKLTVRTPEDQYEQEANSMAQTVMLMREPLGGERLAAMSDNQVDLFKSINPLLLQRREEGDPRGVNNTSYLESRLTVQKGSGSPLDDPTKSFMESRFYADFGRVRVHTDSTSVQMNKQLGAQAFTHGSDIYYGEGKTPGVNELTAHELTHVVQQTGNIQPQDGSQADSPITNQFDEQLIPSVSFTRTDSALQAKPSRPDTKHLPTIPNLGKIGFVREKDIHLHDEPNQSSKSLAQLQVGQRVHILTESPVWLHVAVLGKTGYIYQPQKNYPLDFPPPELIQKDPALRLIKVQSGETMWELIHKVYGVRGNEGSPNQNVNHFINVIRKVNKPEAFKEARTSLIDNIENFVIPGRDAAQTQLIANVDLWIPSFTVAASMDVPSGTITGELSRNISKTAAGKVLDFKRACQIANEKYIASAVKKHIENAVAGLVEGLIQFAKTAVEILAGSTAIGALIGAFFGGVGALPGAEIGFECGLLILEAYGLKMFLDSILGIGLNLAQQLGQFIIGVWNANGNPQAIDMAARSLAEALGTIAEVILSGLVIYFTHKSKTSVEEATGTIRETKFAQTVGEQPLIKWLKERQQFNTTSSKLNNLKTSPKSNQVVIKQITEEGHTLKVLEDGQILRCSDCVPLSQEFADVLKDPENVKLAQELDRIERTSHKKKLTKAEKEQLAKELARIEKDLQYLRLSKETGFSRPATNAILKLEAIKQDPIGEINSQLNHNHYDAARREAKGEIVAQKQSGQPFSHISDLQQAHNALINVLKVLEEENRNPSDKITERGIDILDSKIKEVRILRNKLHGFLSSIGYGKFPPYHKWIPGKKPGTWIGDPPSNK